MSQTGCQVTVRWRSLLWRVTRKWSTELWLVPSSVCPPTCWSRAKCRASSSGPGDLVAHGPTQSQSVARTGKITHSSRYLYPCTFNDKKMLFSVIRCTKTVLNLFEKLKLNTNVYNVYRFSYFFREWNFDVFQLTQGEKTFHVWCRIIPYKIQDVEQIFVCIKS